MSLLACVAKRVIKLCLGYCGTFCHLTRWMLVWLLLDIALSPDESCMRGETESDTAGLMVFPPEPLCWYVNSCTALVGWCNTETGVTTLHCKQIPRKHNNASTQFSRLEQNMDWILTNCSKSSDQNLKLTFRSQCFPSPFPQPTYETALNVHQQSIWKCWDLLQCDC